MIKPKPINYAKLLVGSILGGSFIALGALAAGIGSGGDGLLYALIFPVGLILLVLFSANLFTGAVIEINDVLDRQSRWSIYAKRLLLIYLGNLIGALVIGVVTLAVAKPATIELFANFAAAKVSSPLLELFLKAVLCNILVCIAILLYRQHQQLLLLYLPIFVFVVCGFEHSIADIFVFSFRPLTDVLLPLLIITLGNLAGGVIISIAFRYIHKKT
jgi:formate/nitrite transporter FocA (FNT family)